MKKNLPELLAPAGSWEALVAAVQNGADAVYVGGTKFNARRQAANFDNDTLKKAVEYAHLYGVRIYITLNILIKQKELEELISFLPLLEELKVDGVIVQDLGTARWIERHHSRLSLHASTQMTIHQLEGVRVLEEMGFDRVVLARELTLEELAHISDNSSIELETFIHGALCVSYSGQCLMSSMLGGRSGNRGMCAQPCRLAYTLDKQKGKQSQPAYHISMKDLSTLDFLDEILSAGVTSLKIEGRMKRPEYVAVVTREYRKALDSILKTGRYIPDRSAYEELEQIFNRGSFTKGYYYGTSHGSLFAREKPSHWGIYLGKTVKQEKGIVWIALEEDIETGDSIEFWMSSEGNTGQTVSSIIINGKKANRGLRGQLAGIPSSIRPKPGTKVYRTLKASQLKSAGESYSNIYGRKIPVTAKAKFEIGNNPVLILRDPNGIEGRAEGSFEVQKAVNRAMDKDILLQHLGKLGDTPFELLSADLECENEIFLPVSAINQLRRDAADELMKKRIAYYNDRALKSEATAAKSAADERGRQFPVYSPPARPILNGYLDRLDFNPRVLEGLDRVTFSPASFAFKWELMQEQVQSIKEAGIELHLLLPTITRMYDMTLLRSLPDQFWNMFDGYQFSNLGQLKLMHEKGISNYFGAHTLNVFNTLTIDQLHDFGLKGVVLSPELTIAEIRDIINGSSLPCEILVYGRITLMTLEYCPQADGNDSCSNCRFLGEHTLTDRLGYDFTVRKKRIAHCYSEILNSQPIFLADNMEAIHKLSASVWGLKLEGLRPEEFMPVIKAYRFALDNPGTGLPEELSAYVQELKRNGFTKGHFFRGVE
ncbi:MAG TPA: U32 family peptidase [Clostridiales bacterium]|nr:U32 family peptidase [Clostridiales bacterium]